MNPLKSILLLTLICIQLRISIANRDIDYSMLIPGFRFCSFENREYRIGETFHPTANVSGEELEELCIQCTCNPTTIVQCEKTVCPVLNCTDPIRLRGECCDRCPGENLSGVELERLSHKPELECTFNGITYEHGTSFHPSSAEHSLTENIYCSIYICNNGTVAFTDVSTTCPPIMACDESVAIYVEGSCCKVCPEVVLEEGECKDELGNPRKFNETWNFYSGVYQKRLPCLECRCQGSDSYTCSRNPCPPVPQCPENYKPPEIIICCPECSNKPPATSETPSSSSVTTVNDSTILEKCPFTHNVYLCNTTSMAIEDLNSKSVVMYVWLLKGAKHTYHYTTDEFRNLNCSGQKYYYGGTIERRVNGLQNKEQKRNKILSCKKDCAKMVANMLRPSKTC